MRLALLAVAATLTACGEPADKLKVEAWITPPAATPGPAPAAIGVDREKIVGSWSMDRTCETEDQIGVMADGKVYFSELAEGSWAIDADGRLVLDMKENLQGAEGPAAPVVMTLTLSAPVTDDLVGTLVSQRANEPPMQINAKRCPAT